MQAAILQSTPPGGGGVEFRRLPELVTQRLAADELERLGSVLWHTTTVKLDLEVKGEIDRIPGARPQRLRRPR